MTTGLSFNGSPSAAITAVSGTGSIITITYNSLNLVSIGDSVTISGVSPSAYNGTYVVSTVPASNRFTASGAATGSLTTAGIVTNASSTPATNYIKQIATMAVVDTTDPNFLNILPAMISYAENRIYRELDFLFSSISTTAYTLTTGNRQLQVPAGTFVVPEQINVLLPIGVTDPNSATRYPLLPTTKEFLDAVYGDYTYTARPKYFCPFDDYLFYVGPFPDQNYTVEIVGTYRPQSLGPSSADTTFLTNYQSYTGTAYPNYANTTTTTFISLYLPELFIMASMIYIAAYQRNFSSTMGNDPQMPITYETQYQALLKSALEEENRKKFEAAAWSSQGRSVSATPTRG